MECDECGEALDQFASCSSCGRTLCSVCFGAGGQTLAAQDCRGCVNGETGPELPSLLDGEG